MQSFGDSPSEFCSFSIHNLLEVGSPYGLAAGSWLGPYALCRTLEALAEADREGSKKGGGQRALPMAVYVVSGDADGERGGAPVLCVEDVAQLCSNWTEPAGGWSPLLVLVPLVLGLDKVNPRSVTLFFFRRVCSLYMCPLQMDPRRLLKSGFVIIEEGHQDFGTASVSTHPYAMAKLLKSIWHPDQVKVYVPFELRCRWCKQILWWWYFPVPVLLCYQWHICVDIKLSYTSGYCSTTFFTCSPVGSWVSDYLNTIHLI